MKIKNALIILSCLFLYNCDTDIPELGNEEEDICLDTIFLDTLFLTDITYEWFPYDEKSTVNYKDSLGNLNSFTIDYQAENHFVRIHVNLNCDNEGLHYILPAEARSCSFFNEQLNLRLKYGLRALNLTLSKTLFRDRLQVTTRQLNENSIQWEGNYITDERNSNNDFQTRLFDYVGDTIILDQQFEDVLLRTEENRSVVINKEIGIVSFQDNEGNTWIFDSVE